MAQICVTDFWWSDPRRSKLISFVGGGVLADGIMVSVWRLSQEYWKKNKHGIPYRIFLAIPSAQHVLDADLAIVENDFVYVRGSRKYHQWLLDSSVNGKKGGTARSRNHKGKAQGVPREVKGSQTIPSSSSSSYSYSSDYVCVKEKKTEIPEEIKREWEHTLTHYNLTVNWTRDESAMMRAYLSAKDWERVRLAIRGFRNEQKDDRYDPAKHCNLARLLKVDSFSRLETLGGLAEGKKEKTIFEKLAEKENQNGHA